MEGFKKVMSAGVVAIIVGFVTEWTKLLHRDFLVHPDWSGNIDGDAALLSVFAVIILYIALHNREQKILARLVFSCVVLFVVLLSICIYLSNIVPSISKVTTANHYIYIWSWFFIAADVTAVCAGMTFGLWLAAGRAPGSTP